MANRVRPIRKEICLTEQEAQIIKIKMAEIGTCNFGAYARKMLIDGYIINVDYTEAKKLTGVVNRLSAAINSICRRIERSGKVFAEDIAEIREGQKQIWAAIKEYCSRLCICQEEKRKFFLSPCIKIQIYRQLSRVKQACFARP